MTSSDTDLDLDLNEKLHIIEWEHLNLYKFYPLALASSWSVRCLLYPMSVVKSRLALQQKNNVYRGMRHAFVDIVQKEGFTTLYRGFWVTLPQLSASFIYSTIYEGLRNVLHRNAGIDSPPIVSALSGGLASTCTQLIFVPTDIVAQYMMIHSNPSAFSGGSKNVVIIDQLRKDGLEKRVTIGLRVIRAIYVVDGFSGFYRGFFSSLMLYIPSSMVFWSTYYNTLNFLSMVGARFFHAEKRIDERTKREVKEGNLLKMQAISGAIGGMSAAVWTNPLEVLRIRIQMHRTGYVETMRRLVYHEGYLVFTKGLAPRMISNGVYSFFLLMCYETVKRVCILPEYQEAIVW